MGDTYRIETWTDIDRAFHSAFLECPVDDRDLSAVMDLAESAPEWSPGFRHSPGEPPEYCLKLYPFAITDDGREQSWVATIFADWEGALNAFKKLAEQAGSYLRQPDLDKIGVHERGGNFVAYWLAFLKRWTHGTKYMRLRDGEVVLSSLFAASFTAIERARLLHPAESPATEPAYVEQTGDVGYLDCEIDSTTWTVRRRGEKAEFYGKRKPWGLFKVTFDARGAVVNRKEVEALVWPNEIRSESNLSHHLSTANEVLGKINLSIDTERGGLQLNAISPPG